MVIPRRGRCDYALYLYLLSLPLLFLLHWTPLDMVISRYEITIWDGEEGSKGGGEKVERKIDIECNRSNQGTNQGLPGK
jgi:hypothetical protein